MEKKEPKIRRAPIVLSKNTIALIHVFDRHDHIEDLWMTDWDSYLMEQSKQHKNAAVQFVEQLEDHWTPAFMMALRDEIIKKLEEHDKQCGTSFATRKLDDEGELSE